jgi:hypothetical protein
MLVDGCHKSMLLVRVAVPDDDCVSRSRRVAKPAEWRQRSGSDYACNCRRCSAIASLGHAWDCEVYMSKSGYSRSLRLPDPKNPTTILNKRNGRRSLLVLQLSVTL